MEKKYRFRKIYFQCEDNRVINPSYQFTTAFQHREYAEKNLKDSTRSHLYIWEDQNKPIPKRSVEGFYLVHESLFEEILKKYSR
ncbi:hypothetical protein Pedsa_0888 [Pseudopedobacter saltans DSM 12145]|uniref:Uncharacterized protein n=1 Tax=Pseudopedobacter saltans (strain ATCC 51119 / DSM 12145 / JCM 21818 / CCUG 39354 / LMG 10337 / NBRC 100064 / NCIMB 13643) TaxID=762903 RepID=F0SA83_PSESL|nr:hypothetical protein [Pseudopedobacter saltans]ADY51460.1 hypothetical protein Pedsa_0888 [Pseudopedobacter saltans DSM 12145]